MPARTARTIPAALDRVARRLYRWRQGNPRGARIPEALWSSAVELAHEHGLSKTALALGLDYYSLKRRLEARPRSDSAALVTSPTFVELLPLAAPSAGVGCVLELEDGRGIRLRAEMKTAAAVEIEVIARALWRATR